MDCGVVLTDENQYPSSRKHGKRRCNVHEREAQKRFRDKNPRKDRRKSVLAVYGLTEADYEEMLVKQKGKCAICGTDSTQDAVKKYMAVDHDHTTGKVRQLLCHKCNRGLGHFNDDPELLGKALRYLKKHS